MKNFVYCICLPFFLLTYSCKAMHSALDPDAYQIPNLLHEIQSKINTFRVNSQNLSTKPTNAENRKTFNSIQKKQFRKKMGRRLKKRIRRQLMNIFKKKQNNHLYTSEDLLIAHLPLLEKKFNFHTQQFVLAEYYSLIRVYEERRDFDFALEAIKLVLQCKWVSKKHKNFCTIFDTIKNQIQAIQ